MVWTQWSSILSKHLFRQVAFILFILFFKIILVTNIKNGKEFNQFPPPNSSDDICLFFRLYPSSMSKLMQNTGKSVHSCLGWGVGDKINYLLWEYYFARTIGNICREQFLYTVLGTIPQAAVCTVEYGQVAANCFLVHTRVWFGIPPPQSWGFWS